MGPKNIKVVENMVHRLGTFFGMPNRFNLTQCGMRSMGPKTVVLIFAVVLLIVAMILVGSLVENGLIEIPVTLVFIGLALSIIVYSTYQCRRYGCEGWVSLPTEKESRTKIMNGFDEKRK